jgi:N-acetylated-alpha-linked acidic dipeptidase
MSLQFISEDGIKDREWYRHLGVAPGRWLGVFQFRLCRFIQTEDSSGYGATTLPAITEAITYEHDAKLAQQEADKLAYLVHNMAAGLKA